MSKMIVIDEVKNPVLNDTINFADFLEAVSRTAEQVSLPTIEELETGRNKNVVGFMHTCNITFNAGNDDIEGMVPCSKHRQWALRNSSEFGKPYKRMLEEKLQVFLPFIEFQIKCRVGTF